MLKTSTKRATVSQRPTTVIYCEKPFPLSARASAPDAPAMPWATAEKAMARLEAIPRLNRNVGSALEPCICCISRKP